MVNSYFICDGLFQHLSQVASAIVRPASCIVWVDGSAVVVPNHQVKVHLNFLLFFVVRNSEIGSFTQTSMSSGKQQF